jgi:hypothetical protein
VAALGLACLLWVGSAAAEGHWVEVQGPWGGDEISGFAVAPDGDAVILTTVGLWRGTAAGFEPVPGWTPHRPGSRRYQILAVPDGAIEVWDFARSEQCRWRGDDWSCVPLPPIGHFRFDIASPDDAWLVGHFGDILRWDGEAWNRVGPSPPGGVGTNYKAVRAFGPDDAWILGRSSEVLHWNGQTFESLPRPPRFNFTGTGMDLCRIGEAGVALVGEAFRWVEDTWEPIPGSEGFLTCRSDGAGRLWFGGPGGAIGFLGEGPDGPTVIRTPTSTMDSVHSLGFGDGASWAVTHNRLLQWREETGIVFRDRTERSGLEALGEDEHALFIQATDDNRPDLLLRGGAGAVRLLRNDGEFRFTDITATSGLAATRWGQGPMVACDLDRDGADDLVVLRHRPSETETTLNIFRGRDGWFEPLLPRRDPGPGRLPHSRPKDVDCVDLDGDGDLDIFITSHLDPSTLWPDRNHVLENLGRGQLQWVEPSSRGLGGGGNWNSGSVFGELFDDGAPEVFSAGSWNLGHAVYQRQADGAWAVREPGVGWAYPVFTGAILADLDGDDRNDLALSDGAGAITVWRNDGTRLVSAGALRGRGLETIAASVGGLVTDDADGDGDLDVMVVDRQGGLLAFANEGGWRFEQTVLPSRFAAGEMRAHAFADIDLDGDLDAFIARDGATNLLLENTRIGALRHVPVAREPFAARALGEIARRVAWVRLPETTTRVGILWVVVLLLGLRGRREAFLGFGRPVLPLALVLMVPIVEFTTTDLAAPIRWGGGAGVFLVALAMFSADSRRTRLRRATWIDRFRVHRELGRGGMGSVFLATDSSSRSQVALKVMSPALASNRVAAARFEREALLGARLEHPHIVRVLDHGRCEVFDDGRPRTTAWLSMEYLEGGSLRGLVSEGRPLGVGPACAVARDLLQALQHLHDHGVIHRDLKPDNVMIDTNGVLKLADFGLAHEHQLDTLTKTGDVMGTIRYMPPEQAHDTAHVDERADLYSVGVLLFELLAGRPPFVGDNYLQTLYAVLNKEAPALVDIVPEVSAELSAVVRRALAKRPEDRWQTAAEFSDAVRLFAHGRLPAGEDS